MKLSMIKMHTRFDKIKRLWR